MPTNNENNNSEHNPKKPVSNRRKTAPIVNVSVNTGVDQVPSISTESDNNHDAKNSVTVNITSAPINYTHDITANRISRTSNWVNAGLLVCTLILAWISYNQATSANNAADVAAKTLKADTIYNNKVYKQSRIDADYNDKREGRRDSSAKKLFNIQDSALKQQIAFLKETQKEFLLENRPFLSVINIIVDTIDKKNVNIRFSLINTGKRPLIIIESHSTFAFASKAKAPSIKKYDENGTLNNRFVGNGGFETIVGPDISGNLMKVIKTPGQSLYVLGYYIYKGVGFDKNYFIAFKYKVDMFPYSNVESMEFKYN